MKNRELHFVLTRVTFVVATIVLGAFLVHSTALADSIDVFKFVNPTHGPAKIKGEKVTYYYFKTKITANQKSDLFFRENDCILFDQNGKEYSKYWINVVGWSAGLSVSQRAPIMMKTLSVELIGGEASGMHQWNTSRVDGPNGALEFSIPKGGFVEVYFLWEV